MDCKAVGDRIKARKHELGITANDLCERSGVPLDTINNIVYGRTSDPRMESLAKIAQALDVSLDYLVFGKSPDPQPHANEEPHKDDHHQCRYNIELYIATLNEVHKRELDAQCAAKDELIAELRKGHDFWRTLSCILVVFLALILVWFTWDILHPDRGLIRLLQTSGLVGRFG